MSSLLSSLFIKYDREYQVCFIKAYQSNIRNMYKYFIVGLVFSLVICSVPVHAQPLAFPGAEGFGKFTTGGRGGEVMIVQNLNDNGAGSLREAIEAKGARTITFAVAGTIVLESPLRIKNGDITIAGQSAPGEGITLRGYPVKINADNVIIRYLRFRMGDENKIEDDAISAIRQKNIIIDHCSFSWGTDEAASFYDNENFTLQWSIISESLNNSVHSKGEHGYGGIWGGKGASFHHNLLAHHKSRNPRFNGARTHKEPEKEIVDFRNNVIYNWQANSAYAGESGQYNMINNYYKPGPATEKTKRNRIVNPWKPYGKFYVMGNYMHGNEAITQNNALGVVCEDKSLPLVDKSIPVEAIETQTAVDAYEAVLKTAGASLSRDAVDSRIVEEVRVGNATYGNGIIDSQEDVGGWPELKKAKAPLDSDGDGMPDFWEEKHGLNPHDPIDNVAYSLDKAYTNIELYLNQIIHEK